MTSKVRVSLGVGDDRVVGERADEAVHPGPLPRIGEQGGHVERFPGAGAIVDVRDQHDVAQVGQVVAHLAERLPRSARVREDQHTGPRTVPVRDVQRAGAVTIGRGNLNILASRHERTL